MSRRDSARAGAARADAGLDANLREFFASDEELDAGELGLGVLGEARGADGVGVREYLGFRLAEERFGLEIGRIREIIKVPLITRVPRTEALVLGILSLRGTIVPVIDLRLLLKLPARPQTRRSRVLVFDRDEELIGLLVDEVNHVVRLSEADIEPHPFGGRSDGGPVVGVGRQEGELLALLDLHAVLQLDRFITRTQGRSTLTPEG